MMRGWVMGWMGSGNAGLGVWRVEEKCGSVCRCVCSASRVCVACVDRLMRSVDCCVCCVSVVDCALGRAAVEHSQHYTLKRSVSIGSATRCWPPSLCPRLTRWLLLERRLLCALLASTYRCARPPCRAAVAAMLCGSLLAAAECVKISGSSAHCCASSRTWEQRAAQRGSATRSDIQCAVSERP